MYTFFQQIISLRVFVATIAFVSVLFLSWWIPIVCAVVLALRYAAFEVVALGLFMDLLWFSDGVGMFPLCTLGSMLLVWLLTPLREQLLTS